MSAGRFHPTKETLIKTVLELLKTQSVDEINSDEVLEKSGISKGSMYHHFEDFSDLLEHAQVARFAGFVDRSIDSIASLLVIKDKQEFAEGLRGVTKFTQSTALKEQRLHRVTAISRAGVSERMRKNLATEQSRLTAALADLYREVVNRGWGNPKLKPETLAVFIQAYTLGQIVNDYVDDQMDLENWLWLIDTFMSDIALKSD
jgi:AcrR family transcriptional regulator